MFSSYWKKQVLSFLRCQFVDLIGPVFCVETPIRIFKAMWGTRRVEGSLTGATGSTLYVQWMCLKCRHKACLCPPKAHRLLCMYSTISLCGVLLRRFISLLGQRRENNCSWLWTSRNNQHRDPGTAGREKWPPFPLSECKSTGRQYPTIPDCVLW